MDACAGNVTDVCKIGQELLLSVRNFSQCAIASDIEHLPVEDGTARLSAAEWVLAPGEMETEGIETIAEIAAEDDGEPDSNYMYVELLPVMLEEAEEPFVSFRVRGRQYSSVL